MTEVNPSTKGELRIFTVPGADTAKVDAARALLQAVAPAGFDVPATLQGSTQLFNVYFERGLDVDGPALADAVLGVCDRDYQTIQGFFGGVIPNRLPFNIIIGQGFGGAYHYGCDGVDLYCDSDINNIDLVRMLVVAEEPGVGFGAALAGLDAVDPGADFACAPSIATASFGNHDFPLWQVDSPDRAVVAGEVMGHWLWLVLWPDTAGVLLIEPIGLRDLRDPGQDLDLPFRAASPRLPASSPR